MRCPRLLAWVRNEGGMQALDAVLVLGVAALVIALVTRQFWPRVLDWFSQCLQATIQFGA